VEISAPSGAYTIRVSHKGTLVNGAQDFSIIATGVSESEFNYTVDNIKKKRCSDQDVEFKFNYESSPNFNGPTTLSVSGLPEGITATLTPSVITEDEDFVLLITDLSSLDSGSYPITVSGVSATSSKIIDLELEVVNSDPLAPTVLDFPSNGASDVFIFPTLEWDSDANASLYTIQISESSDFSTFIFEATSIESQIDVPGLKSNSEYFWRVKASTDCTEEDFVGASFTTEDTPCFDLLAAADTPISIDVVPNEIQSIITIPESENVLIGDINIGIDLSHTWLADLTISVVSPAGTEIILMQGACGEANDINVVFDDSGSTFVCGDADPAVSGVLKPANSLSSLIEETSAGDWTLKVVDGFNEDGGVLNNFSLEFCSTAGAFLSLNETTFNRFDIFPNPAKAYFEFSVENQKENFELNMYDVNGRVLMAKVFSSQQAKRVNTQNLTTGIYFVEIKNGIQRSIKKLIIQ
jgi:subtilisin-like proprotein convertase family protein